MVKLKKVIKARDIVNNGYDLRLTQLPTDVEVMFRASTRLAREDLSKVAGKYVLLSKGIDENGSTRYYLRGVFEGSEGSFSTGSFNASALAQYCFIDRVHGVHTLCTECGKRNALEDNHRCGAPSCRRCGGEMARQYADGLCDDCARDLATLEFSYHRHPSRDFCSVAFERPHLRKKYCHLGAEIEIDSYNFRSNELALELGSILNKDIHHRIAKFEHDGSISDGTECILEPITYKGLNNLAEEFEQFYTKATEINGNQWGTGNGLHFHIDREYFEGADNIGAVAISMMVYKYYDFFKMISGRKHDNFYYASDTSLDKTLDGMLKKTFDSSYHAHSDAVNVSNSKTIEVRIFGGYIDTANKFLAVADIVNAMARWAKETPIQNIEKATPCDLVRYINNPQRVLNFVNNRNAYAFTSAEAQRVLTSFTEKLNQKNN